MNKKSYFVPVLAIIAGLLLSACASGTDTPDLGDTQWKLESYGPAVAQIPAAEGIETSLQFGVDGQVSGNMGCNSFSGEFSQEGNQITFGFIASTLRACPDPQMNQEGIFFSIMSGTVDFRLEGDRLTIDAIEGNQIVLSRQ
jgi:putative lipoprotein